MHHSAVLQMVHAPPFSPLNPGLHTHAVIAWEPCELLEFAGHAAQVLAFPAPCAWLNVLLPHGAHAPDNTWLTPVEYVPAPQFWQSDAAVLAVPGWYVPAPHCAHAVDATRE